MSTASLIGFLCLVGIGSYLQAFTGFALGIFVLGAVVILQLVSVDTTATAINIMTLVNTAIALRGNVHLVNRRLFIGTILGVLPGVPVGLWLLETLSARSAQMLQLVLGLVVIGAGAILYLRPQPRTVKSGPGSFIAAGALGGLLGGLFSIPGPPVIYHFYVQPMRSAEVRLTLLSIFGTVSFVRLGLLAATGSVGKDALYLGLTSIPMVALTTALFLRYPPRLSERAIRRAAFILLSSMGVCIFAVAWL